MWYLEQESQVLKSARIYRQASTILTDKLKNVQLKTLQQLNLQFYKLLLFKMYITAKLTIRYSIHENVYT